MKMQNDPAIKNALSELKRIIRKSFPDAQFSIYEGDDGVYLKTIVDIDDTDQVMDIVIDRLITMQVEERLPIFVSPRLTKERNEAIWKAQQHV